MLDCLTPISRSKSTHIRRLFAFSLYSTFTISPRLYPQQQTDHNLYYLHISLLVSMPPLYFIILHHILFLSKLPLWARTKSVIIATMPINFIVIIGHRQHTPKTKNKLLNKGPIGLFEKPSKEQPNATAENKPPRRANMLETALPCNKRPPS